MELVSELNGLTGTEPITQDELDFAVNTATLTLPGSWETNEAVMLSLQEMVEFGLPSDYFDTLEERTRALTLDEVNAAARNTVHPQAMIWVVVGDKAVIEDGLKALGLGPVFEIDADGNVKGRLIGD